VWLLRQQSRRRGLAEVTRSLEEQEARAASSGGPSDGRAVAPDTELDELPGVPEELLRMTKKQEDLRQQATTLASTEPQAAAQLIRAWLVKKKSLQAAGGRDAG
jgi:flagellar biosynthesis/type III secretory pathway M-ring protein FliF/YscJ